MSGHVFVVSEWLPKEGCEEELWVRLKEVMALTAEKEKGCMRAHATRQILHPVSQDISINKIVLLQEYVDIPAFDLHCKAPYVTDCFQNYVENPETSLVQEWSLKLLSEEK